jgi:glutathione peroxidase
MNKTHLLFVFTLLLSSFRYDDSIYAITLKNIDSKDINLSDLKGKKMVFCLIPLVNDGSGKIEKLDSLQKKFSSRISFIGVPAIEAGFKKSDAVALKKLYLQDLKMNMLLTEGMNVNKTSGQLQSSLFNWITNKERNGKFNEEIRGVGQMFFVDENGLLFGITSPAMNISEEMFEKILNRQ